MDRKLADALEKQADITKTPFIQNDITERILEKTRGKGLYHKFEIDLTVAHTDEYYNFSGDRITVESVDDAVTIKLNDKDNSEIDMQKIPQVNSPFKRFYVNNSAGSGTLKILCGSKGMFEAKKKLELINSSNYIIYKDGSLTKAYNCNTGYIEKSDSDADVVIQYALDNLTSGRTHKETIAFKGAFTINAAIDIPSYTILDFNGASLTLGDAAGFHMLQLGDGTTGVTDVEIMHGVFDGNRAGQSALKHCIYIQDKGERVSVHNNYLTGWYGKGIYAEGGAGANQCTYISVCNNMMDDFQQSVDADGIDFNNVQHGVIKGNLIKETGDEAIDVGAGADIVIIGNEIRDCVNGIELYATKVVVVGNSIDKVDEYGIVVDSCKSTVCIGNYIYVAYKHGIRMLFAYGCTVIGNTFWRSSFSANNTYNDIMLEDKGADHSTHNVITGNTSIADYTNKVKYMIEEADANQDYNIIKNNNNVGAVTGNVHKQGVNSIASDNI